MTTTPPSEQTDDGSKAATVASWRLLLGAVVLAAATAVVAASWEAPQAAQSHPPLTVAPTTDPRAPVDASERHQDASRTRGSAPSLAGDSDVGHDHNHEEAEVLAAAVAALHAWATFATTGELKPLADHFHPAGPQYRQLAAEASTIGPDGVAYSITLEPSGVTGDGDRRVVRGGVTWSREGEPVGQYDWVIQMRRADDRAWRVWTVTAD